MSSDRQRLVGAIRRIAGIEPDNGESTTASANRGSQPGAVGQGITESDDRLCCDGSVSGSVNPGINTNDPSKNEGEGLDTNDPADMPGNVSGLTDCETGEPVCFSGSGFIPPDGWEDPGTPADPNDLDVEEVLSDSEACASIGLGESILNRVDFNEWYIYRKGFVGDTSCSPVVSGSVLGTCGGLLECPGGDFAAITATFESVDYQSAVEHQEAALWPSDSCVNLSIAGGKIVGSKFDPENDGSYSAPRDEIELCDGSNGSILIRGSASGGWKSIASLSGDIDPDTDHGYLYSAYGDMIRQISPSEFRDDRV